MACVIIVVILEINRLPLYRKISPGKARRDEATGGYDPRFGTTAYPTQPGEEPTPGDD
jgi:hypothetical protein